MATAYRAPEGFEPPQFKALPFNANDTQEERRARYQEHYAKERQAEQDYLKRLAGRCKQNGKDPILGEIIRFGRGDGYAEYMVWSVKPLQLIWIQLGDAWSVEAALIRGLTLTEVRRMVAAEKKLGELFGQSKWALR